MNKQDMHGAILALSAVMLSACEGGSYDAPSPAPSAPDLEYGEETVTVTGSRIRRGEFTSTAPLQVIDAQEIRDEGFIDPDQIVSEPSDSRLYLAYRFATTLRLPADDLASTHDRHTDACFEAGPQVCQVISASVQNPNGPRPSGFLQLRANPAWIVEFRDTIATDIEAVDGEITADETSIEDLTSQIVDAEARLDARTTLRDRLQTLLETRDGELNELLRVERELARVQEQLDAQASVLAVLRQRVNTSTLTLSYVAKREIVEREQFNPIISALRDVGEVFSRALADVIRFIAGFLPWLIVIIPGVWLIRRLAGGWFGGWLKRRREAQTAKSP